MKQLFIYWIITASLWILIYFITCFIYWEIKNPLYLIINIPNDGNDIRALKLITYFFYSLMMIPISSNLTIYYNKNKKP